MLIHSAVPYCVRIPNVRHVRPGALMAKFSSIIVIYANHFAHDINKQTSASVYILYRRCEVSTRHQHQAGIIVISPIRASGMTC